MVPTSRMRRPRAARPKCGRDRSIAAVASEPPRPPRPQPGPPPAPPPPVPPPALTAGAAGRRGRPPPVPWRRRRRRWTTQRAACSAASDVARSPAAARADRPRPGRGSTTSKATAGRPSGPPGTSGSAAARLASRSLPAFGHLVRRWPGRRPGPGPSAGRHRVRAAAGGGPGSPACSSPPASACRCPPRSGSSRSSGRGRGRCAPAGRTARCTSCRAASLYRSGQHGSTSVAVAAPSARRRCSRSRPEQPAASRRAMTPFHPALLLGPVVRGSVADRSERRAR